MRGFVSALCICAMVMTAVAPATAGPDDPDACRPGHDHQVGAFVSDAKDGRMSFRASNGYSIEGRMKENRLSVVITDDSGRRVGLEVSKLRAHGDSTGMKLRLGDSTLIQSIQGQDQWLEIDSPSRGRASHADPPGQLPELALPGLQRQRALEVVANADLAVYRILHDVALDEASAEFWAGFPGLALELQEAIAGDVAPAGCFWVCTSCVGAILAWIAATGALIPACGSPLNIALCYPAIIAQAGSATVLFASCGECGTCLEKLDKATGEDEPRGGTSLPAQG